MIRVTSDTTKIAGLKLEILLHPSTKLLCSGTARIGANMKAQTTIQVENG